MPFWCPMQSRSALSYAWQVSRLHYGSRRAQTGPYRRVSHRRAGHAVARRRAIADRAQGSQRDPGDRHGHCARKAAAPFRRSAAISSISHMCIRTLNWLDGQLCSRAQAAPWRVHRDRRLSAEERTRRRCCTVPSCAPGLNARRHTRHWSQHARPDIPDAAYLPGASDVGNSGKGCRRR